ncbi:MAG TPA: alpha/beta hydrolase fold domain-containing protein, partial [Solirubrobacteraceae bacterium]|nr:alpha/beta hydrolase fold domain-containing protein [Solirubrobacteraceae bacterium]
MPSAAATKVWELLASVPVRAVDMDLPHQREAGEHAEDLTSEPEGVRYEDAPEVGGFWALPPGAPPAGAVLYLFGGGYVISAPRTRHKTAGHLARASGARVLVPDYRLAPEHPFPAALDDAVRAYEWLLGDGNVPERTVVAGDSSAGGLAVASLLVRRDAARPQPAGAVGISPWADLAVTGETMRTRAAVDVCA